MKSFNIKLLSILLIFCLGLLVYSNTFYYPFHFDDLRFIINNPVITNIQDLQGIWHYWHCRFMTILSLALNFHFNGLNVFGYHLFNVVVHLFTAILVWWLTLLTLSTPVMKENKINAHANSISLLVGLVFVSHPVQIESVTNIWQRASSMAALFYLASLCFYVKSRLLSNFNVGAEPVSARSIGRHIKQNLRQARNRESGPPLHIIFYICSLLLAVLAMFTKENTVTLPLMVLLYEGTFLKTKRSLDWQYILPFLVLIFVIPFTLLFNSSESFQDYHGDLRVPGGIITPLHYFLTQFRVMLTYIRLVFVPVNQNIDYDYPIFKNVFELQVICCFLFLIVILYWAKCLFEKYRLVSFSIYWFFLTLTIPESSFWAMGEVISEHRLYLPLVGYSMFLVSGVYYFISKDSMRTLIIVLSLIILCYSVMTYQRNKVWRDEITLWGDAVAKSPHKIRPLNNLGIAYASQGNFSQAIIDFTKAIAIDPQNPDDYNNRGIAYSIQGNFSLAIADFTKAIELDHNNAKAYFHRGLVLAQERKFTLAVSDYNKVIEIMPGIILDPVFSSNFKKASGAFK